MTNINTCSKIPFIKIQIRRIIHSIISTIKYLSLNDNLASQYTGFNINFVEISSWLFCEFEIWRISCRKMIKFDRCRYISHINTR